MEISAVLALLVEAQNLILAESLPETHRSFSCICSILEIVASLLNATFSSRARGEISRFFGQPRFLDCGVVAR